MMKVTEIADKLKIQRTTIYCWRDGKGLYNVPAKRRAQLESVLDDEWLKYLSATLIDNGYDLVPLSREPKKSKAPDIRNWQKTQFTKPIISNYVKLGYFGIGIKNLFAIDVDITDKNTSQKILDFIKEEVFPNHKYIVKYGAKPKFCVLMRAEEGLKGFKTTTDSKEHIEFRTSGQVACYTRHPKTEQPYEYEAYTPFTISKNELSVCTVTDIQKITLFVNDLLGTKMRAPKEANTFSKEDVLLQKMIRSKVNIEQWKECLESINSCDISEINWTAIIWSIANMYEGSDEGLDLAIEWSQKDNYPDFDVEQVKNKYARADFSLSDPRHIFNVASQATEERIQSDMSQERKRMFETFVFVTSENAVYNLEFPYYSSKKDALRTKYSRYPKITDESGKHVSMFDYWLKSEKSLCAAYLEFRPDKPAGLFKEELIKSNVLNTFLPPKHTYLLEAHRCDISDFKDLLVRLFKSTEEMLYFVAYVGNRLKYPGHILHKHLVHVSKASGTGRGLLFRIISAIIGDRYCKDVIYEQIEGSGNRGQYDDFIHETLLVYIPEIEQPDRFGSDKGRVKALTGSTSISVNQKGGRILNAKRYAGFWICMNDAGGFIPEINDRRFEWFFCDEKPIAVKTAKSLEHKLLDNPKWLDSIYSYLLDHAQNSSYFNGQRVFTDNHVRAIREQCSPVQLKAFEIMLNNQGKSLSELEFKAQLGDQVDTGDLKEVRGLFKSAKIRYGTKIIFHKNILGH